MKAGGAVCEVRSVKWTPVQKRKQSHETGALVPLKTTSRRIEVPREEGVVTAVEQLGPILGSPKKTP